MSVDTISNMLSAIKNASLVGKPSLELPYTKQSEEIAKIMKASGYLANYKVFKHKGKSFKGLTIEIAYDNELPRFENIKRISKPGRRVYRGSSSFEELRGGYGTLIVSTSRGLMTASQAKNKKLGGEVICVIK